jgi:hypothetical protein
MKERPFHSAYFSSKYHSTSLKKNSTASANKRIGGGSSSSPRRNVTALRTLSWPLFVWCPLKRKSELCVGTGGILIAEINYIQCVCFNVSSMHLTIQVCPVDITTCGHFGIWNSSNITEYVAIEKWHHQSLLMWDYKSQTTICTLNTNFPNKPFVYKLPSLQSNSNNISRNLSNSKTRHSAQRQCIIWVLSVRESSMARIKFNYVSVC